jgi:hypothetical protein
MGEEELATYLFRQRSSGLAALEGRKEGGKGVVPTPLDCLICEGSGKEAGGRALAPTPFPPS